MRREPDRGGAPGRRCEQELVKPSERAGLEILLAEDNKINQQFALALLNRAGRASRRWSITATRRWMPCAGANMTWC